MTEERFEAWLRREIVANESPELPMDQVWSAIAGDVATIVAEYPRPQKRELRRYASPFGSVGWLGLAAAFVFGVAWGRVSSPRAVTPAAHRQDASTQVLASLAAATTSWHSAAAVACSAIQTEELSVLDRLSLLADHVIAQVDTVVQHANADHATHPGAAVGKSDSVRTQ